MKYEFTQQNIQLQNRKLKQNKTNEKWMKETNDDLKLFIVYNEMIFFFRFILTIKDINCDILNAYKQNKHKGESKRKKE